MNNKHIILLHGWGGSRESLSALESYLVAHSRYFIHRLEMPGHGRTPEMTSAWAMSDFSNWLKRYIDENKIKEYILVGHSFGGKIILDALSTHKLNPKKIVLIDANGIKPRNSLKKKLFKVLSKIMKPLSKIFLRGRLRYYFYRIFVGEVDYVKTSKNVKESFKLFNEENYDSVLDKIETETLIIWGQQDMVTPLWMGKKMNELIKNSKIVVIAGTHGLPRKEPEQVGQYIIEFIKND